MRYLKTLRPSVAPLLRIVGELRVGDLRVGEMRIYQRLTHANVWQSMGNPCSCKQFIKSGIFYCKSCKNPYQYKSRENPYQALQVTRAASERAMKSKVRIIKSLSP